MRSVPGSISGMKFHDVNNNGAKDSTETGLSGWHILLNGTTYFGTSVNQSAVTDGSGNYSFSGIWPGNYTVSEVWRNGWTQTYPANLGVYHIGLGVEENRTGVDFGNIDSVLTIGTYRTFLPENLALAIDAKGKHKPIPIKPDKDQFWATFHVTQNDSVSKLKVNFKNPYTPGTLTSTPTGTITAVDSKFKVIEVTFPVYLPAGSNVTISGYSGKLKPEGVQKFIWTFHDSTKNGDSLEINNVLRYPMPNAINVMQVSDAGLKVGLGGPHSVVHLSYKDVLTSLVERGDRMHLLTSVARCLDKFAGTNRSIKKQQRNLSPTKGNNKLFAEMIALKTNILASDFGVNPAGFGNLIFDEGNGIGPANPFKRLADTNNCR